jgi:hypothetical protein
MLFSAATAFFLSAVEAGLEVSGFEFALFELSEPQPASATTAARSANRGSTRKWLSLVRRFVIERRWGKPDPAEVRVRVTLLALVRAGLP